MTEDRHPHDRAAVQLLDLFRAAGLSRGSRLAFGLVHKAWRLAGTSEGREQWRLLVDSSAVDAVAALTSASLDLGEGRERLSALSSQSARSALLLVDQFCGAHGRSGLRDLAEALLSVEAEGGGAMDGIATPRWVADLMAELLGPAAAALDPVLGIGDGLLSLAERGAHVCGFSVDKEAASIARARLEMAEASARIEWGDFLQGVSGLGRSWDAVVIATSFGLHPDDHARDGLARAGVPQVLFRGRQGLFWLHLAAHLLEPGGRAAVLLTEGSTFASPGLEQLLDEEVVEGVISLPPNFLSTTAIPATLWLVRPPGEATGRLLVADATPLAQASGPRRRNVLSQDAADMIVSVVRRFREGPDLDAPGHIAKSVAIEDVDLGRGLTPALFLDEVPPQAEVLPEPAGHLLTGLAIGDTSRSGTALSCRSRPSLWCTVPTPPGSHH